MAQETATDGNDARKYHAQSFSSEHDKDTLDQLAENRGYENVSPYLRELIRQDIQRQIAERELEIVPSND